MKDNQEDSYFFSNPVCKQTYNSLPKIYGGSKQNKNTRQFKKNIIFRHIKHQCIQSHDQCKLEKSIKTQKKRYSETKNKYLSLPKGQKCTKKHCLCSMIHQQQPKTLRKNMSAPSPKKMKLKLRPIKSFKPDDFQSQHKVVMKINTQPSMPLGLHSLVANKINTPLNNKISSHPNQSFIDQLVNEQIYGDGSSTKRMGNENRQSGYATGNQSNKVQNTNYRRYTQSVAIGTDNNVQHVQHNTPNRIFSRQQDSGLISRGSILQTKEVSCVQVQVNLDQDAIEQRSEINQESHLQSRVAAVQTSPDSNRNMLKQKITEAKYKRQKLRKNKYYISQQEDNQQSELYEQDYLKKIQKQKNQNSSMQPSRVSSSLSLNSCLLKGIGTKPTEFQKLNLKESADNLKASKVGSVKSNGTFRVPSREEYAKYLKSYKIMDKNAFNLKQLVKKPLFTIVEEQENGGVYFGQYKDDGKQGSGIHVTEKEIFEGFYEQNKKIKGCERNIDGVYRGYFVNGKRQGYGVFQWNNGQKFEGNWKEGVKSGFGIWRSPKGDYYEGEWYNNRQQGEGVFKHRNSVYRGTFQNFLKHGKGEEKFANGDSYEGEYFNGKPQGIGRYSWSDGSIYEGNFIKGMREGKGKWIQFNGDTYEGLFSNDFRHGQGKLQYHNGEVFEGIFKNGKEYRGTLLTLEGKSKQINNQAQQQEQQIRK